MSNSTDLLSARNLILASAAVFVLSLLGMCISMLRPQDSGGLGRDSYGTRAGGNRALVEILEELGVSVSRSLSPPEPDANDRYTLVMLDPNARLVAIGPKYAQALRQWIEDGGRVVVTPSTIQNAYGWDSSAANEDQSDVDILAALDVDKQISAGATSESTAEEDNTAPRAAEDDDFDSNFDWDKWNPEQPLPLQNSDLSLSGSSAPASEKTCES